MNDDRRYRDEHATPPTYRERPHFEELADNFDAVLKTTSDIADKAIAELKQELTIAQARVAELEKERDRLYDAKSRDCGHIQDAIAAMGNGADEERWPSGTHVVTALIAERDQLKARAEKAEADARWFVRHGMQGVAGILDEWADRSKPYEAP